MLAVDGGTRTRLTQHIVQCVDSAETSETPFFHLVLDGFFPDDIYERMVDNFPVADSYRSAIRSRNRANLRDDGTARRVKIDLFPEYIRHLQGEQKAIWECVGGALCSPEVKSAFVRRLSSGLRKRFGDAYERVGMFPVPMLTRDTEGYRIREHTDTRWKGITVQLYLPRDTSLDGIGTVFSEQLPDGKFRRVKQMSFIPNHGYAFAVGTDTWHSVDALKLVDASRDTILHTYYVDHSIGLKLRNRSRRLGNFVRNELRARGI